MQPRSLGKVTLGELRDGQVFHRWDDEYPHLNDDEVMEVFDDGSIRICEEDSNEQ